MSQSSQALWFDAVPLLVVAAAYLGATAVHANRGLDRAHRSVAGLSQLSVFPVIAVAAMTYGIVLAVEREPPVGGVWLTLGLSVLLAVPPLLTLAMGPAPRATAPSDELRSRVEASTVLGNTNDAGTVAAALLDQVEELPGVELALVFLVDSETRIATGLLGHADGRPLDWVADSRIDLDREPSGVGTAVFEASAFAVYDASTSKIVSRRMVEATGAKSVAFVPLVAEEQVIAVLVAGSVSKPHAFPSEELTRLQAIAAEAPPASMISEEDPLPEEAPGWTSSRGTL